MPPASETPRSSPHLPPRLRRLASLLDERFTIPGTKIRFGYDGLIGLIPGVGDTATTAVSLYIVWQARKLGLSTMKLLRMVGNVGLDWLLGTIPLVGDIFDVGFKANLRNLRLIEEELSARGSRSSVKAGARRGAPLPTPG